MKQFLCGLAILPFLSAVAMAQPATLSEGQMDTVRAGWSLWEQDCSNTSNTVVVVYGRHDAYTPDAYLVIDTPAISISSSFGPCCQHAAW
jgi:hypothetical protein